MFKKKEKAAEAEKEKPTDGKKKRTAAEARNAMYGKKDKKEGKDVEK